MLLYAGVILQEKKIWVVQFTNCTAQGGRVVHAPPFQVQFSDIRVLLNISSELARKEAEKC